MATLPDEIHNPQFTQLSIARFYGGIKYNGAYYVVVPVGVGGDWKLVREDVLKAQTNAKKRESSVKKKAEKQKQKNLL